VAEDLAVEREVWIGLVEVVADEGNEIFEGGLGASPMCLL
jgi:hypothetical protein